MRHVFKAKRTERITAFYSALQPGKWESYPITRYTWECIICGLKVYRDFESAREPSSPPRLPFEGGGYFIYNTYAPYMKTDTCQHFIVANVMNE